MYYFITLRNFEVITVSIQMRKLRLKEVNQFAQVHIVREPRFKPMSSVGHTFLKIDRYIYLTLYFEKTSNLQKMCKDGTVNSYIPFTGIHQFFVNLPYLLSLSFPIPYCLFLLNHLGVSCRYHDSLILVI